MARHSVFYHIYFTFTQLHLKASSTSRHACRDAPANPQPGGCEWESNTLYIIYSFTFSQSTHLDQCERTKHLHRKTSSAVSLSSSWFPNKGSISATHLQLWTSLRFCKAATSTAQFRPHPGEQCYNPNLWPSVWGRKDSGGTLDNWNSITPSLI